jgi:hypothetical protein
MALLRSPASTTPFARFATGALLAAAAIALRGEPVRACAGGEPTIETETTFDPAVIGDATWKGLYFDEHVAGYGDRCDDCLAARVAADWHGYLGSAVADADWHHILYDAGDSELGAVAERLAGKPILIPKDLEHSSIWASGAPADKLRRAIAFVQLARRVEAVDTFDAGYDNRGQPLAAPAPTPELLADAKAGLASAHGDAFLVQRYGLQVLRVLFYRRDWPGVESFYDQHGAALLAPSTDLAFRARYYDAGAVMREGKRARGNLELARIAADDPPMAGFATRDFQPMEDTDWKKALALATTTRDKTALWRLVGIKADPLVAAREIVKLDPRSDRVALLVVRELARAESLGASSWGQPPEPAALAAQAKSYAALQALAASLAATPGVDSPWVIELVLAHIAARHGDVATTRAHVQKALALRGSDARVAAQAKASLALALVADWKINPAHEEELATLMAGVAADKDYGRADTVREQVRGKLAAAYLAAGKLIDAELLVPNTLVPVDEYMERPPSGSYDKSKWTEVAFIQQMIARLGVRTTAFDKLVTNTTITEPQLETDLALRHLLDGDYALAAKTFATTTAISAPLHTEPFVAHIRDCHDCDHDKYAKAAWTHATFAARLAELAKTAAGTGEPAADAAMLLGNALYNITWFGNARVVTDGTHEMSNDTAAAARWYKRAYDLTTSREKKAKAAYMAAKCERGALAAVEMNAPPPPPGAEVDASSGPGPDLTPGKWFAILRLYANTSYYKDVLRECGTFSTWIAANRK